MLLSRLGENVGAEVDAVFLKVVLEEPVNPGFSAFFVNPVSCPALACSSRPVAMTVIFAVSAADSSYIAPKIIFADSPASSSTYVAASLASINPISPEILIIISDAPSIVVSSSGLVIACFTASIALSSPCPSPIPICAMPFSFMTV